MSHHREAFFDALADDFNTPRALAALFEWVREANARAAVGDADLREMLAVLGLGLLARRPPDPQDPRAGRVLASSASGARPSVTLPRRTVCAIRSGRWAGRSGTAPTAPN